MTVVVDYSETMESIIDGLIRHNEKEIVGKMLMNSSLSLYDLEDKQELEKRIRFNAQQTAYQILGHLKKQLGTELQIMSEGEEVLIDFY